MYLKKHNACVMRFFWPEIDHAIREITELTRFSVCSFEKLNLHGSISAEARIKAIRIRNLLLARCQTRAGVEMATWPFDAGRLLS